MMNKENINYEYKKLCPFKWFVLENFPFIEADFDALTNWQLFCKLGQEMNKIITSVNLSGEQVEILTEAFNNLQNYVNNYFKNLDVQDEINNKLDEMAKDGSLTDIIARFLKYGFVSNYGGIEGENLTTVINNMIYTYNLSYIFCDVNGQIDNIIINNDKNITINFLNKEITFSNKKADETMFNNYGNLTILNGYFNGNNNNSITLIRTYNLSNLIVDNCKFMNFYEDDNKLQTKIIMLYTGSYSKLTRLHFENIKQVGNGIETDAGGAASCILSQDENNNVVNNETSCIIDDCTFKNNWNVNAQGEFIIEDFDSIKLQNDLTNDNSMFIISNINNYNSGKRVIKAQTNNVSINNVRNIANNFSMLSTLAVFGKNCTINNIVSYCNNMQSYGIELLSCNNIVLSNLKIKGNTKKESLFSSGIIMTNTNNINISNCILEGFSSGLTIWDNTDNIYINNCNFKSIYKSIYINTRTSQNSNPESGITIKNIYIDNCNFKCDGESKTNIWVISKINNNNLDNINFNNCHFQVDKTNYLYGTFFSSCNTIILSNCTFDINNTNDNIYNYIQNQGICKLINCRFNNSNNTPYIIMSENSRFYIDKLITNSNIRMLGNSKTIIQYSQYNEIKGNTDSNSKIDSFDMQ